jgi:repressor LexA
VFDRWWTHRRHRTRRGPRAEEATMSPTSKPTGSIDEADPTRAREDTLTERQRSILAVIQASLDDNGYPPSVREIGDAVGLSSTSSVHAQLETLESLGYLRRDGSKGRAMELGRDPVTNLTLRPSATRNVPLVGEIAAGAPILADERVETILPLPESLVGDGELFMLTVRGESMIEAGVLDGDLVVIRAQPTVEQGQMCAALIDGEATVKFFRRTRGGEVFLDPANAAYEPIEVTADQDVRVLGKVVSVLRSVR